jgi:HlyD family secretion protein
VTRRNIQEGETAVIGTMNNAGTVLLTLADMSVIQAEVEVDETSIPHVSLGQRAEITIDALPEKTFGGVVTEIGSSPIQGATSQTQTTQATNFKVVIVLDQQIADVRPGFTCAADITTATRPNVTAVPIPAVAVRELIYDSRGQIVRKPREEGARPGETQAQPAELGPGETRKEVEGVFVVRNQVVQFTPVQLGIAGDRFFEVVSGLQPGDVVVTGPYDSVRTMTDGDTVTVQTAAP